MTRSKILFLFFFFSFLGLSAQVPTQDSLFRRLKIVSHTIVKDQDTIFFYTYNNGPKPKKHLILFLGGSDPRPNFSFEFVNGELKAYHWSQRDFLNIPENCLYVLVAQPGMQGVWSEDKLKDFHAPSSYLQKNSLDYRVWQASNVVDYCRKKLLTNGGKVAVYGHSEGFNVVSRLLTVNRHITHAGLWCGSAMPDYQDFLMMDRKDMYEGKASDSLTAARIDTLLNNYKVLFANPGYAKPGSIYTNKRWISYARGPLEDLKNVNIPLYMIIATQDDNAPPENAYIVPLEFTRLGKTNLTLKTCVGCGHSLSITQPDGGKVSYWKEYFKDFIKWLTL